MHRLRNKKVTVRNTNTANTLFYLNIVRPTEDVGN